MTWAPASRASCVTIDPTAPAAPCAITLCPARRRPCSNSPCHAVRPEIGRLAPTVKSTSPGSGARLRASIATYSARVPSRYQFARPSTRCPTDTPVVPYPRAVTNPASSCPGIDGVRSRPRRSVQVEGHASSVGTNPDAWTLTTTSFIAACGSGRSTSFIPAVPAAWSVTTIAFIGHLCLTNLSFKKGGIDHCPIAAGHDEAAERPIRPDGRDDSLPQRQPRCRRGAHNYRCNGPG